MGLRSLFRRGKKRKQLPTPLPTPLPPSAHPSKDELRLVFQKFDANGDGKISASELGSILSSLGGRAEGGADPKPAMSSWDLDAMIREVDADGDGFIDMDEFVALNTKDGIDPEEVLKDAFAMFDMDKNGAISADELLRVLRSLGENCTMSECKKMIEGVDRDGNGMIDFDEFKAMMTKGLSSEQH